MKRKSLARKSVSRKSLAKKPAARKSLARKSISRKSLGGKSGPRKKSTVTKISKFGVVEYTAEAIAPLLKKIPNGRSPIDVTMSAIEKVKLPSLVWANFDSKPLSLAMTNTTHSVVVTGDWPDLTWPTVSGGPLDGEFKFSQIHFHWSNEDTEGSEHSVNGSKFPVEGHMVFFKKEYKTHDEARNEVDGIIIFVNFYELQDHPIGDLSTNFVAQHLRDIRHPYRQKTLEALPLSTYFEPIIDDYLLYYGVMEYKCKHDILWFISRKPLGVNKGQLSEFREVKQTTRELVAPNFREMEKTLDRTVFMVNPTRNLDTVLLETIMKRKPSVKSVGMPAAATASTADKPQGKRQSMKRQSVKRKSMKRQSVKRKSMKRQSVKKK